MDRAKNTAENVEHSAPRQAAARRVVRLFRAVDGCSQALRAAVDAVAARHGLGATQLLALWSCSEAQGGVGQSELAEQIGVSAAQASALVEQLRRRGLIASRRDPADRRRQLWTIADAGRDLLAAAVDGLADLARRVGEHHRDENSGELEHSLRRVAAAAFLAPVPRSFAGAAGLRVVSPSSEIEDDVRPDRGANQSTFEHSREARR